MNEWLGGRIAEMDAGPGKDQGIKVKKDWEKGDKELDCK